MKSLDNYNEPGPNRKEEDKSIDLSPIKAADWTQAIGKMLVSKDGLDMGTVIADEEKDYQTSNSITIEYGDRERFNIAKDTIYKFDQKNVYTSLTENEILASRKDDPFSTSIRSYTHD